MSEEQRRQLRQQLWNIADTLRGKMHADEFRDYILGFIFYKYLSEKIERFANSILESDERLFTSLKENNADDLEMIEAVKDASIEALGYFLRPSELFHAIAAKGNNKAKDEGSNFVIPDLTKIFKNIEHSTQGTNSEEKFINLFEDLDLTSSKLGSSEKAKNELITKILSHLVQIDFQLDNIEADVLGDAYEYLIGEFASGAGKKAGEFYTPQEVSTVLSKLVTCGNRNIRNVYDPTCGSGSLLLRVKKEATAEYKIKIYGQELNRTTYNLARMNMLLHDVHYNDFDIKQEDTLEHPQHLEHRFDAIVANPPFSAKWSANQLFNSDDRFGMYGKLAPSTKADMAFVQHMLYQLADDGVMAVVLPHGVLFRGAAEGHIRQYFIEKMNCLDAVIGLPANIFYGTGIPTCILVFKQCRKHPDDILFIDASKDFEKIKTQNMLLPEHINKIIAVYENRSNEAKYSRVVSLAEIKANEYNLNIPRYVDSFEAEARVDLEAIATELYELELLRRDIDTAIKKYCEILSLPIPVGCNFFLWKEYKQGVMQRIFSQELRFKDDDGREFTGWESKKFGEIFSFRTTNSFSRENLNYENGSVRNIHYGDIHTKFSTLFDIIKEIVPFINSEIELKRIAEDNYCKTGDLIIADASEDYEDIGKCIEIINLNNEKVLSGLHTILARPDLYKMYVGFSGHLMKSNNIHFQIKLIAQGTKVLSISSKRLSEINLIVPTLPEQQKIADFLTAIDKKIELLIKQKRLLQLYKQGVMQRIFSQEIRFTDDDGREFPEWEVKKADDIFISCSNKNHNGNLPILASTQDKGMIYRENLGIDIISSEESVRSYKIVEKGDFVISLRSFQGGIEYSNLLGICSPAYTVLKPKIKIIDNFFKIYLKKEDFIKKLNGTVVGIRDGKQISYSAFSTMTLPYPCIEEQTKIANFLTALDEKIALY